MFRFHTGSIKSAMCAGSVGNSNTRFDSILVRLKDTLLKPICPQTCRFDSILVRLKERRLPPLDGYITFRFHTGSIKSRLYLLQQTGRYVSIPYWFD